MVDAVVRLVGGALYDAAGHLIAFSRVDGRLARTYNGKEWVPAEVIRDLQALVK